MSEINIREARRRLSELVDAAQHGESTLITRHGRPAARIVPIEAECPELPDLVGLRRAVKSKGKPLSRIVIESRRRERY